jgi:hypothetical protein
MAWEHLGETPADLVGTRLQLQYAVQLVAAVGQGLVRPRPDDSQQSLELRADLRSWLGATVQGRRAGLDPATFTLFVASDAGVPLASLPLAGRTLEQGLVFLRAQFAAQIALPRHPADFPHHPAAEGARLDGGSEAARTFLQRLYANTHRALFSSGAPLRMWPHHFDLACTRGRTSAGFSPGDGSDGLPYWYATYSPPLETVAKLAGKGRFRETGWKGAELLLSDLGRGPGQEAQLAAFFQSAFAVR